MYNDPIVDEIHRFREEQAAKFDFDIRKIVDYYKKRQHKNGCKIVNLIKKPGSSAKTLKSDATRSVAVV